MSSWRFCGAVEFLELINRCIYDINTLTIVQVVRERGLREEAEEMAKTEVPLFLFLCYYPRA